MAKTKQKEAAAYLIDSEGQVTALSTTDVEPEEDTYLVTEESDLENVPTGVLVEVYNQAHEDTPIKKFVNSKMAASRTWPVLAQVANPADEDGDDKGEEQEQEETKPKGKQASTEPRKPRLGKFVILKDGSVLGYSKVADARTVNEQNEGSTLITSQDDLLNLSMKQLTEINNAAADEEGQVKKFPSKEKGAETVFPLLSGYAMAGEVPEREKRTRTNSFAGKVLHVTQVGRDARRRPDTRRTTSWNALVEKAGKKGQVSYEDYIGAGGHADDLATIVRLGHAEVK